MLWGNGEWNLNGILSNIRCIYIGCRLQRECARSSRVLTPPQDPYLPLDSHFHHPLDPPPPPPQDLQPPPPIGLPPPTIPRPPLPPPLDPHPTPRPCTLTTLWTPNHPLGPSTPRPPPHFPLHHMAEFCVQF